MIKSMTGFGRAELVRDGLHIGVELRSVNNRYLDLNLRIPRRLSAFEGRVRAYLKRRAERGKIEGHITCERMNEGEASLIFRPELAAAYFRHMEEMRERFLLTAPISPADLARMPEVFGLEEDAGEDDGVWSVLEAVLAEAADAFVASREEEGARLRADLEGKLSRLLALTEAVEEREPQIFENYRQRIREKVAGLLEVPLDEGRLATEIVLYADRICTDEETTRLKSHISAMRKELSKDGGVGRKLDFLSQELNREANTILSKANDLPTSDLGIEMKTEIEKIREQIQNIE